MRPVAERLGCGHHFGGDQVLTAALGASLRRRRSGGFGEQCEDGAGGCGERSALRLEAGPQCRERFGFGGVCKKAVVPDLDEASRQDVLEEAAQELFASERHGLGLGLVPVVLVAEADLVRIDREDTRLVNGDPVDVAGEVEQ